MEREIPGSVLRKVKPVIVIIINGAFRVEKTFFLREIIKKLNASPPA